MPASRRRRRRRSSRSTPHSRKTHWPRRCGSRSGGGRVVVADDSGLCVDALDGRPGVYSKRWSGRSDLGGAALDAANNQHLLRELEEAAERGRPERTARYVCAVACAWPAAGTGALGQPIIVLGESVGTILSVPRGSRGFGYDPWFSSPALGGAPLPRSAVRRRLW